MKTGISYTLQVIGSNFQGTTIKNIKLEVGIPPVPPIIGNISITGAGLDLDINMHII